VLEARLDDVHGHVATLRDRLAPVLTPCGPVAGAIQSIPASPVICRVSQTLDLLEDLLARLEV
jgi:hypothetical protein